MTRCPGTPSVGVLRSGETSFEYEREVPPRPKLGRGQLDELLASNTAKAAREQLTLIRIFEELRGRGYTMPCVVTQAMGQGTRASDCCGLCPAELRVGRGFPMRLEP